jgi:hypothetical protein
MLSLVLLLSLKQKNITVRRKSKQRLISLILNTIIKKNENSEGILRARKL